MKLPKVGKTCVLMLLQSTAKFCNISTSRNFMWHCTSLLCGQ
jgi:hypothetical protein